MNIFNLIKQETAGFRDKPAIIESSGKLSYAQLIQSAENITAVLARHGVGQFCRVGILCDNCADYVSICLAVLSLSAVVVPISPDHTRREIEAVLSDIQVNFLLFKKDFYPADASQELSLKTQYTGFFIKATGDAAPPNDEYCRLNPAFIRFSSGTTGKDKGVVLSHQSIIDRTDAADRGLHITPEDTILWVLSMSFHFVVTILLYLRRAATIVLCHAPFPELLAQAVADYPRIIIYAAPFHYDLITQSSLLERSSLRNVRLAISTTAKLPNKVADGFFTKFGFELAEAYGIIEVGLPFMNLCASPENRASVGRILPDYAVRLINRDADGTGEICLKGKGMLDAYFSPWQNRQAVLEDGWFKTGDLGRQDADGLLTIVGRRKEVINFAGMKVFPAEVEAVIDQHPLVVESMVYGEDHPRYGQLPAAKIVLKSQQDGANALNELRRFCYQKLASYKVPKEFIFVERLPKTTSGKIKRLGI